MSHYFRGDVLALEAHGLNPVGSSRGTSLGISDRAR